MRMTFVAGAIGLLSLSLLIQPATAHEGHDHGQANHQSGDHAATHDAEHCFGKVATDSIEISDAWARATIAGQKTAAGYMIVHNLQKDDDTLVSVTSPAAERVEIHLMEMKNDTMVMRPVENGLTIAAQGTVELAPGGYHLMFLDIDHDFNIGDTVQLKLTFEKAGTIDLDMPVRTPAKKTDGHGDNHGAAAEHHH